MSTAKQSDRSSAHRRKMPKPAGDEVGYGRPPAAHRFKPGHSGNPRGRPKAAKNEATILRNLLNRKIDVRQGGTARKITVFEAILLRITEDALKGNTKSAAFLFNRCAGTEADAQPDDDLSADDDEVLAGYARRLKAELMQKRRRS
jgi:hypothetical protein